VSNAQYFLEATYLIASCLFILGLKGLSHPDTARRGMILAAAGMSAAVLGTLFHPDIHNYTYIAIGLILGSCIGIPVRWLHPW
jgi:NAD(P) transhydrogenase subunit beta